MGCDIHPQIEVKHNGAWRHLKIGLEGGRNYSFFAELSNVRGQREGDSFFEVDMENGNASDWELSTYLSDYYKLNDFHTWTLVTFDELVKFNEHFKNRFYSSSWLKVMKSLKEVFDDVRIIAYYDN